METRQRQGQGVPTNPPRAHASSPNPQASPYRDKDKEYPPAAKFAKSLRAKGRINWLFEILLAADPSLYPANLVRNIALAHVKTSLVFMLDIDLIPDMGFYR